VGKIQVYDCGKKTRATFTERSRHFLGGSPTENSPIGRTFTSKEAYEEVPPPETRTGGRRPGEGGIKTKKVNPARALPEKEHRGVRRYELRQRHQGATRDLEA